MSLKNPNKITGAEVRQKRIQARLKAYVVAEKMGVSPSLLCKLEGGYYDWTDDLYEKCIAAIKALK